MNFGFAILRRLFRAQRYCFKRPKPVLILAVLFTVLIGAAAPLINTSNDLFLLYGPSNVHHQKLLRQQADFGENAGTLLMLSVETIDNQPDLLTAERYLSALLSDHENPLRPTNLVDFASITRLLPALGHPLEFTTVEDVAVLVDEQPRLQESFFNDTNTALILPLSVDISDLSDSALKSAFAQETALTQHIETKFPNVSTAIIGGVSISEAMRGAMTFDRRYLFPLTLLVNFLVLLFAFGNLRITVAALGASVISVILTLGVAGWSGHVFATAAVSSFSIVMTLTVASLIHVIHAIGQRQRRLPFQSNASNILACFRKLSLPVIIAHATTAVGFLSLNWAHAPAFRAMGNLVAIGLGFSLIIVLFISPIVLALAGGDHIIKDKPLRNISHSLTNLWEKAPSIWALAMGFAAVVALLGLTRTVFDDQFVKYFADDHPLRQNIQKISDQMGWSQSIDLVLRYEPDKLLRPETFVTLEALVTDIKTLSIVADVKAPLNVLQNCLQTRTLPFLGPMQEVPPKMLNYCVRSNWLVTADSGNATFAANFRALHISIMVPTLSSYEMRTLAESIENLTLNYGFTAETAAVSGVNVMSSYLSKINTQSMLVGSAFAMLIVSVLIGVFLRSVSLALLSIIPNFLPAMASLGLWVWFHGEVGMAASVIAALTFGIVVDDTIHILYALTRGQKKQRKLNIARALQNVLPGVLTTTIVLGFGFALIMLSGFAVNQQLGFLTSSTIFIAFLFDLFVLPSLFLIYVKLKTPKTG